MKEMKKIIILLCVIFLYSCSITSVSEINIDNVQPEKQYQVSLVAVGDNLIHHTVYEAAYTKEKYDFKPIYKEIKPFIKQFDLAFINQETILGGIEIGLSSYPRFNSPYELGNALVDTGFNLISIANNHTLDKGEIGVLNAIDYLDKQPIIYSGATKSSLVSNVKIFKKNNIRFAFVAYTYGTNGILHPDGKKYLANLYSNEKARKDIENIKNKVDVIIVSMHWGSEYQNFPNETQIEQAKFLSNLGVNIIIGHHPHVIQPVKMLNNTFVIYSLGNFLSDQKGIDRLIGMAVSINIRKTVVNNKINIDLINPNAKLLYRYKDINNSSFNIKLFEDLNNILLDNYQMYFESKKQLIQSYYKDINVN